MHGLVERGVGFRVLTGHGSSIDTTTASGKLIFGIFAALAEFERELISERTRAGLASARARGRKGGRKFTMTAAKVRLAQAGLVNRDTEVAASAKNSASHDRHSTGSCLPRVNSEMMPCGFSGRSNFRLC